MTSLICTAVLSSGIGFTSLSLSSLIYKVEVTVAPIYLFLDKWRLDENMEVQNTQYSRWHKESAQ